MDKLSKSIEKSEVTGELDNLSTLEITQLNMAVAKIPTLPEVTITNNNTGENPGATTVNISLNPQTLPVPNIIKDKNNNVIQVEEDTLETIQVAHLDRLADGSDK